MADLTREQVIAFLSQLRRPELRELILELEERWGIERPYAGEPIDMTMGMPIVDVYSVVLVDHGSRRISVMQALREHLRLALKDTIMLVDRAPVVIAEDLDAGAAQDLAAALRERGANVEVRRA